MMVARRVRENIVGVEIQQANGAMARRLVAVG